MADNLDKASRSVMMAKIRSHNTRPEIRVRRYLHKAGFRFRLHRKDLPGKPDLVLPMYRTALFVHGCFWHQHQGCKYSTMPKSNADYWTKKLARNLERDSVNFERLVELGWRVLIVWECSLKKKETASIALKSTADWLRSDKTTGEISGLYLVDFP
jgi:DNA mismatch endonuclease (patch repair protein)